jgi:hypothetical protein
MGEGTGLVSRPVISADDVRAAHRRREHRVAVPPGAIVTPLARDEAAKWGIELVEGKEATPEAASPPAMERAHVPTCDPDDLERVIERVRARVPDADPAVVREIAERVLARLGQ